MPRTEHQLHADGFSIPASFLSNGHHQHQSGQNRLPVSLICFHVICLQRSKDLNFILLRNDKNCSYAFAVHGGRLFGIIQKAAVNLNCYQAYKWSTKAPMLTNDVGGIM